MRTPEPVDYLERPVSLTTPMLEDLLLHLGARDTKQATEFVNADHCFLHHNNSPTLGISMTAPHGWVCFSCGAKGPDAVSLVQRAKHLSTRKEAYTFLAERYSLDTSRKFSLRPVKVWETPGAARFELPETVLSAYPLDHDGGKGYEAAEDYLGAPRRWADHLDLGYRRQGPYLVFVIRHPDGAIGGLVARCLRPGHSKAERWLNLDGGQFKKEAVLLGSHLPLHDQPVVVVEGPKDYCKMRMFGWKNVRALLGDSSSEFQLDLLASYNRPVVPLLDGDAPGVAGTKRLTRELRRRGVKILTYRYPNAAYNAQGKADPGLLTPASFKELIGSFTLPINLAVRLSRLA